MRSAPAQVTVEGLANLALRRSGGFRQERRGSDQDAARAVPELGRLLGEKGVLQRMQLAAFAQAFNGGNSFARGGPQRSVACGGRMAVDQDEACAALAVTAAEARTFQPEIVAECVEKRRIRTRLELGLVTIDGEPEALGHGFREFLGKRVLWRACPSRPLLPRISRPSPTSGCPAPGISRTPRASCALELRLAWPRLP